MKKTSWLVILLAVIGLAMVPGMAGAQQQYLYLSISQSGCTILDFDGDHAVPINTFFQTHTETSSLKSSNQNVNATCHYDFPDTEIPLNFTNAEVFHGRDYQSGNPIVLCSISVPDGTGSLPTLICTSNWHQVITPSGNVTLTCHFKAGDECGPR